MFHQQVLTCPANWLVAADSFDTPDAILICAGGHAEQQAAELYHSKPGSECTVIVLEARPNRLVRLGITKAESEFQREILEEYAVPHHSIKTTPVNDSAGSVPPELVDSWLTAHPQASMVILEDRFRSRQRKLALASALPNRLMRRVRVMGLCDDRYNETNWWKSKSGTKAFASAWFELCWFWLGPDAAPERSHFDPDRYERWLLETQLP